MAVAVISVEVFPNGIDDPDLMQGRSVPTICSKEFGNWVIESSIGTPAQKIPLRLDLARAETWAASNKCRKDFCKKQRGNLYDTSASSTAEDLCETVIIKYEKRARVKGKLFRDILSFGEGSYTANTELVAAYDVCKLPEQNFAGSFGFKPIETSQYGYNSTSVLKKRGYSQSGGGHGSVRGRGRKRENDEQCFLSWGIDPSLFKGELIWLPFPTCSYGDTPYWKTPVSCLKIDGVTDLRFKKAVAEFISVTNLIKLPPIYFNTLVEEVGGTYNPYTKEFQLDCCKAKDLTFSFKDYDVTIPSSAWTIQRSEKVCSALIVPTEYPVPDNHIQIGTAFLNNFYSYYSEYRQSIGLALLNNDVDTAKIVPR